MKKINYVVTTTVHKTQHWMCHWFSQMQTTKTTSKGLVQVLVTVTHKNVANSTKYNCIFYRTRVHRTRTFFLKEHTVATWPPLQTLQCRGPADPGGQASCPKIFSSLQHCAPFHRNHARPCSHCERERPRNGNIDRDISLVCFTALHCMFWGICQHISIGLHQFAHIFFVDIRHFDLDECAWTAIDVRNRSLVCLSATFVHYAAETAEDIVTNTTAPYLSKIVYKIWLTRFNPFLPKFWKVAPVHLSVGNIRWQIAAEWLVIAHAMVTIESL